MVQPKNQNNNINNNNDDRILKKKKMAKKYKAKCWGKNGWGIKDIEIGCDFYSITTVMEKVSLSRPFVRFRS